MFCFKKFCLIDENTPMKIGMDSVLLGAWANSIENGLTIDLGSGCGLLTFMMAQRFPDCEYIGIEIHEGAFLDSLTNLQTFPQNQNIHFYKYDFLTFDFQNEVDTIISNPPYFSETIHPKNYGRFLARTQGEGFLESMVRKVADILSPHGIISLVYDTKSLNSLTELCLKHGLFLQRSCFIKHFENHNPKRVLLQFGKISKPLVTEYITLRNSEKEFGDEYKKMTRDFYLNF